MNKKFAGTHWTKMPNANEIKEKIKSSIKAKGKEWLRLRALKGVKARNGVCWNKGLEKEKQPRFNKPISEKQREAIIKNFSIKGEIPWNKGKNDYFKVVSKVIRAEIRNRANFKCEFCGKTELEEGRELHIHHNERFENKGLDHLSENLKYLCNHCHLKLHYEKENSGFRKLNETRKSGG